jgi:hypothetical protein
VFFWTAVYLYGFQHFAGVRSPFLWQAMVVYGTLFVVAAQLCWFGGLRLARPADISLAGAFSPVAAIMFALVILGETPTPALVAGGAVILVGIAIGQFGRYALHTVLAWRGWLSRGDRSFRPARLSPPTDGRLGSRLRTLAARMSQGERHRRSVAWRRLAMPLSAR